MSMASLKIRIQGGVQETIHLQYIRMKAPLRHIRLHLRYVCVYVCVYIWFICVYVYIHESVPEAYKTAFMVRMCVCMNYMRTCIHKYDVCMYKLYVYMYIYVWKRIILHVRYVCAYVCMSSGPCCDYKKESGWKFHPAFAALTSTLLKTMKFQEFWSFCISLFLLTNHSTARRNMYMLYKYMYIYVWKISWGV